MIDLLKCLLNDKGIESLSNFLKDHKCIFYGRETSYAGAIGGAISYKLTPTSLGTVVKVECGCGAYEDVTPYDEW